MNYSPPDSSVHEISQMKILEWVTISFSEDLPDPGIKHASPALAADSLPLSHLTFTEHLLLARYYSKHFICINSFNHHNNPMRQVLLLSAFYEETEGMRS